MRWQRPARWIVAALGIGAAIVLYVQTRERPPADRPAVAMPSDPEATAQSREGTTVRFRDGQRELIIDHKGEVSYPDGRIVWSGASFSVDDGTLLSADVIESSGQMVDGQPAEMKLRGNVRMDTSEGASIRSEEARYTHATGVAILPGAVSFARGRLSGTGTDGEYHRDTGVFHLRTNATIRGAAEGDAEPVEGTAASMTFNRVGLALLLDQNARIVHARQTMTSDRATLYLTEDQNQFRVIELRGRANVTPVPGEEAAIPAMRAQDIDLAFHEGTQALERAVLVGGASMVLIEGGARRSIEGGEIRLATAPDGRTITQLDGRDNVIVRTPPQPGQAARTIMAPRLTASGDEANGLTAALFDGGVRFIETVPAADGRIASERTGTSQTLAMKLAGQLDAIEEAQFQRNVTFRDGDVTGDADLGTYFASKGQLTLRPARTPVRLPRVSSGRVTVDAREVIDVDLNTQDLHAVGDVKTVSAAAEKASQGASDAGLFNDNEATYGFGTEFWYERATGRARYRGTTDAPARLSQGEGDTVVIGVEVDLADESRDLTAKGSVVSTFVAAAQAGAPEKRYRVTADTLEYREQNRAATYGGSPVTLTGPDGVTSGQTMVMTMAAQRREIERLDVRGDVQVALNSGHDALADSLLYEANLSRYTLRGRPMVLRATGDTPDTCSLWRGRMAHFTTGGGSPEFPPAENPGRVVRTEVPCKGALQK